MINNFLGKVLQVNQYYNNYLTAVKVNDVRVQFYYLGRSIEVVGNFNMMDLGELSDDQLDWENENFRPDINEFPDHRGNQLLVMADKLPPPDLDGIQNQTISKIQQQNRDSLKNTINIGSLAQNAKTNSTMLFLP